MATRGGRERLRAGRRHLWVALLLRWHSGGGICGKPGCPGAGVEILRRLSGLLWHWWSESRLLRRHPGGGCIGPPGPPPKLKFSIFIHLSKLHCCGLSPALSVAPQHKQKDYSESIMT